MYCLLLLMGVVLTSDGLKEIKFCSGKRFSIPAKIMSTVPLLSSIYFTPITPGANASAVMNMTQSLDPHYQFKDETIFIRTLSDRDQGTFSWSHHDSTQLTDFLKMVMKDCAEQMNVYYGQELEIFLLIYAQMLEFSPSTEPSDTQVLWRRTPLDLASAKWSVDHATSDHDGIYSMRSETGVELKRIRVTVKARTKTFQVIIQEERNLDVPLPIPESKASITFTDPSGTVHSLYEKGRGIMQALSLYEGRFSLQNQATGSHLQIRDLKPSDAGTYEVRDSKGLLMVSAVVESRDITGCSEQINVYYEKELKILFPSHADLLEFFPSFEPFKKKVLWSQRHGDSAVWSVSSATSYHAGNYTAHSYSGLVLWRTCVTVTADPIPDTHHIILEEETTLTLRIPLPTSQISITFRNPSDREYVFYRRGEETRNVFHLFEYRLSIWDHSTGSTLQLYDLRQSDVGTYEVRDSNNLLVLSALVESSELPGSGILGDPQNLKYAYITIAVIAIIFVAACWCVCKCCSRCCKKSQPRNQRPGIYSAPAEENLYRPPVARSPVAGGFSQIPTAPSTQAENTSEYHLPPHLSPQPDAGACFQPTRRNGDSLDFLFTSPLTTDRIPDSVYTSEKLNFL